MSNSLLPGSTLGILGGGQLGKMLVLVAKRIGYYTVVFTERENAPAAQVSDQAIVGNLDDRSLLSKFGKLCDVITYETENIPIESCRLLEDLAPVRPNPDAIFRTQHRVRERELLTGLGIPTAPYHVLKKAEDLEHLPADFKFPAIMKTACFGYDGKGQMQVSSRDDILAAWTTLDQQECIIEQKISFSKEFSVIVAGSKGSVSRVTYGPIENHHERHILDLSLYPGTIPTEASELAVKHALKVGEHFSLEGVLTIEFFLAENDQVIVNEIAPRPHNSGHLTIEGFSTSQFEQQLRGICCLPLGNSKALSAVAMVNLLGELWSKAGKLNCEDIFAEPGAHLHLYGKNKARVGRKMGHLTVVGENITEAKEKALALRTTLTENI